MKKMILGILMVLVCATVYGAVVSTYTEIDVDSLHGNILKANAQANPADGLYYPLPIQLQGSSTSDTGVSHQETVYAYFGTGQEEKFTTALEWYQALPAFLQPKVKELGMALIDVDMSE